MNKYFFTPFLVSLTLASVSEAHTCRHYFGGAPTIHESFAKRSPHDAEREPRLPGVRSVLGPIREAFGFGRSSGKTEAELGRTSGESIRQEFESAQRRGELEPLATATESTAHRVHDQVHGLVMGERYNQSYFDIAIKEGDQFFAFDGKLVRLRPQDGSLLVIPRILEIYTERVIGGSTITNVRLSWINRHFLPKFPQYNNLAYPLSVRYSSWNEVPEGLQLHAQVKIQGKSFAYVHIEFRQDKTLVAIRAREERESTGYFAEVERHARESLMNPETVTNNTAFRTVATKSSKGEILELKSGEETTQFLRELFSYGGFRH